jgi:hypothetical protein
MSENGKIEELVDRLIQKTRNNEVAWRKSVLSGESLTTSFPRYTIKIGRASMGEWVVLSIYDGEGEIIAETPTNAFVANAEKRPQIPQGKLVELYTLAQASMDWMSCFNNYVDTAYPAILLNRFQPSIPPETLPAEYRHAPRVSCGACLLFASPAIYVFC